MTTITIDIAAQRSTAAGIIKDVLGGLDEDDYMLDMLDQLDDECNRAEGATADSDEYDRWLDVVFGPSGLINEARDYARCTKYVNEAKAAGRL